jgi:tetratricopeptide (TPR) repeat protein
MEYVDPVQEREEQLKLLQSYIGEAEDHTRKRDYQRGLESYNLALEIEPSDKNCLVARSKCHLQLGDAKAALEDANASLVEDDQYIKGLLQKAEALYQMGDFESSLMFYHRGNRLRPELQDFRLGIQKAREAIENPVGSPSVVKLEAVGDLSHFQKQDEGKTKKPARLGYSKPASKMHDDKKKRREPRKEKSEKEKETTKQLLGELYADKIFLDKLLKDNDLTREDTDSGEHIYSLVNQGIDYLDTRTEFWRQQKPMYARKREKEVGKGRQDGKSKPSDPANYVLKNLEEIDKDLADGHPEKAMKQAKKVLKKVEGWRDEDVTDKQQFLSNLHSSMGNAQLDMGKMSEALKHHRIDLQISKENDFEDGKSRALDNLGRVCARTGQFKEAIQHWKEKLPLVKSTLEATWLYHEIGRCHLELSGYSQARDFGEKSLKAAQEAGDDVWQLNASVLVAQSEVKLGDLQDAIESFECAHEMAIVQGDKPAQRAISKALEELNQKIVQSIRDGDNRQAEDEQEEELKKEPEKPAKVAKEEAPAPPKTETREEQGLSLIPPSLLSLPP